MVQLNLGAERKGPAGGPARCLPVVVAAAAVAPIRHQNIVVLVVAHDAAAALRHLKGALLGEQQENSLVNKWSR